MSALFLILAICLALHVNSQACPASACCTSEFPGKAYPVLRYFKNLSGAVGLCHHDAKNKNVFFNYYDPFVYHSHYTAYLLNTADMKKASGGRLSSFWVDPQLKSLGVPQLDPMGSNTGYGLVWNRGHLAPSKAMSFNNDTWRQCYFGTNIAPQSASFNQVGWRILEENVFKWVLSPPKAAGSSVSLYVVTGTWYNPNSKIQRFPSGLGIPDYFYKVICDLKGKQSAGFFGKNLVNSSGFESINFNTVASLQTKFNIDFKFPAACNIGSVSIPYWWEPTLPPIQVWTKKPTKASAPEKTKEFDGETVEQSSNLEDSYNI